MFCRHSLGGIKMGSHLSLTNRLEIMKMLNLGMNFSSIAAELEVSKSTISREIKNRRKYASYTTPVTGIAKNACIHRRTCRISQKCSSKTCFKSVKNCRSCIECSVKCGDFKEEICTKYNNPPYVCNGCSDYKKCTLSKWIYDADYANNTYIVLLSDSRKGISIDNDTLEAADKIISPLLKRGQSVRNICLNNMNRIMISEKTVYRYIGLGLLSADKFDLKRTVQRKERKKAGPPLLIDKECRRGRTYADFQKFLDEHDHPSVVQMDTVEGVKGGKVLLTLFFCSCNLQLAFLRDSNTSASVTSIFQELQSALGSETFSELFPVILTDRGAEFSDPLGIEVNRETGEILTSVFYCDPRNSNQKSECERNHEYIRYVIPKGKSIDPRCKEDIDLMMNHINSTCRKSLNDKNPIDIFETLYGSDIAKKLGIVKVQPTLINLTPELFKK